MDTATRLAGSIVVGIDGSDHADHALVWGAEQAHLEDRRLVVAHGLRGTLPLEVDWFGPTGGAPAALARIASDAGTALVDAAVERVTATRPGLEVDRHLVRDDPREVLIAAAREAHLVVVGAHGRSRWRSLALGSVSAAVSRHAACPVVVTHDHVPSDHRGILVGADGTAESLPVIEFAFRQASLHRVPLRIVHAFWDIAGERAHGRRVGPDEAGVEDLRLLLSESVVGFAEKFPDVAVDPQLARGLVDLVLTEDSQAHSLVVVGRRAPFSWSRLLYASATTAVVERARGPVAVVPQG